jgi:hypothetical protein
MPRWRPVPETWSPPEKGRYPKEKGEFQKRGGNPFAGVWKYLAAKKNK